MKRIMFLTIVIMLSIGTSMAQDFWVGTWGFSYDGTGGVLAWGTQNKGAIVVPSTATNGTTYTVTGIRHDFGDKCVNNYPGADITSVQLPEGILNIQGSGGAFVWLSKVTTFNIPSTVTSIGNNAFTSMSALTSVYSAMTTPVVIATTGGDRPFYATTIGNVTLHIPVGTASAYAAAGWIGFGSVVEDIGAPSTTVPDAPTAISASAGNAQASVSFTAPSNNGGATITGYTVTSSPGGFTQSGAVSPITVTGLTNGTAYTFTVVATNSVGNSAASAASNSVTPAAAPAYTASTNVALGKAITGYPNTQMIDVTDGSFTTKYNVTPPTLPTLQYYILDFGATKTISYAIMGSGYTSNGTTSDSAIKGMKLQSSNTNNGSDWIDIPGAVVTNNPVTNVQAKVHFPAISTRYVKWVLTELNSGQTIYKPAEIEIYNPVTVSSSISTSSMSLNTESDVLVSPGALMTIDNTVNINSLTVSAGGQATNSSSLTAGTLTIKSDAANGTGTYLSTGTSTITTANVQQYLATTRNWYVSSPVTGAVAPSGYSYYQRDEAAASWTSQPFVAGNTFVQGKGYIALPNAVSTALTFSGQLNMGNVTVPLTWSGASSKGYNLIGNPYPSHLTWTQAFVDDVTNAALIEPSIYYRTNTGSVNLGGDAAWSFKTYNSSTNEFSPAGTTNIIPPMQAFWVKAKVAGNLILNSNLTRSHQATNPLKAPAVKNTDRQRLRLSVNNGLSTDESLIYFDADALNTFDRFDSPKMLNGTSSTLPDLYTMSDAEILVINGMQSIPSEIPLYFKRNAATTNQFRLSAIEMSNFDAGTLVFVKNYTTGDQQLVSDGAVYTFDATIEPILSILIKVPGSTTGLENYSNSFYQVYSSKTGQIVVSAAMVNRNDVVSVFTATGQLVYTQNLSDSRTVLNNSFTKGMYVVKVNQASYKLVVK